MRYGKLRDIRWIKTPEILAAATDSPADLLNGEAARWGVPVAAHAMSARAEAVLLLQAAAEVEHILAVQYLYAAYSLETDKTKFRGPKPPANAEDLVNGAGASDGWRETILEIAREEMGHLVTVQNLLRLVGGKPHLDREHCPGAQHAFDPFPLKLEPITRAALAKYVTAEMPALSDADLTKELREIREEANAAAGVSVSHVGLLYARLYFLFQETDKPQGPWRIDPTPWPKIHLSSGDFVPAAELKGYLADAGEWRATGFPQVMATPVSERPGALEAIYDIARQGEGPAAMKDSHYERFLGAYREFRRYADPSKWVPARDVATNPNTSTVAFSDSSLEQSRIRDKTTLLVARLCNLRYRMLLTYIGHALALRAEPQNPTFATRADLAEWAVRTEMKVGVSGLANQLTQLPVARSPGSGGGAPNAGPPFELPDGPLLPGKEKKRWGRHLKLIAESKRLMAQIRKAEAPKDILDILVDLETADNAAAPKIKAALDKAASSV